MINSDWGKITSEDQDHPQQSQNLLVSSMWPSKIPLSPPFYMVISFPIFSKDVMFSLTTVSTEQSAKPFLFIYSHVKVHSAMPWYP